MSENTIKAIINAKKSGKSYAAIDFVASNPELPAILSKLVTSQYPVKHDNRGFREIDQIDQTTMKQASDVIAANIRDADVVMGRPITRLVLSLNALGDSTSMGCRSFIFCPTWGLKSIQMMSLRSGTQGGVLAIRRPLHPRDQRFQPLRRAGLG